ncbi:hypothetical protein DIPPA_13686 [Diplonema papillatum]|nr:hypothetical protein DIPPA_13686 [Diplonema papillatum]
MWILEPDPSVTANSKLRPSSIARPLVCPEGVVNTAEPPFKTIALLLSITLKAKTPSAWQLAYTTCSVVPLRNWPMPWHLVLDTDAPLSFVGVAGDVRLMMSSPFDRSAYNKSLSCAAGNTAM